MHVLQTSEAPEAKAAVALFVRSVLREIGAYAAVLGGVDALVFTGGIGENATPVRTAILNGCQWLGVQRDKSEANDLSGCLSMPDSPVSAWVIPTDENLIMARHALRRLHSLS
ncbi:hypothetical protein [Pseudomonas sp. TH34]|uniref:hypothetical protein n=1 Tax=Pseudomonas sp. TH34 TaxID=2796399 RepID=UPI001F5B76E7|nr:hypothetical protein [Pseudomonas sp. TH34]